MKVCKLVALFGVLFIVGCSNQMYLTYSTQPQGAMLSYSDGSQQLGVTPITLTYVWNQRFVKNGCYQTKEVAATWVSGAKASSPGTVSICGRSGNYNYTLSRPNDAEGLEKDMMFAQEVERTRAIQQQTAIARQQSSYQMIQMFNSMQPKSSTTTGTMWDQNGKSIYYRETTK